jgi:hypothetical protein
MALRLPKLPWIRERREKIAEMILNHLDIKK